MNSWTIVALGLCFCASCGGRVSHATVDASPGDVPDSSAPDASAESEVQTCSDISVPQEHRTVAEDCPAERGSIGPVVTTSCTDPSALACTSDADCTTGSNGRCLQSLIDLCQTFCSYDECLEDTDCPNAESCVCRSGGASTAPNVCAPDSNCRTDADCGDCGFCSPNVVANSLGCSHQLGALTTCGVAVMGNGTQMIRVNLGECSAVLTFGYACHGSNDECTNDSDCTEPGGYCAYSAGQERWTCGACSVAPGP